MEDLFGTSDAPTNIKGSVWPNVVQFHPSANVISVGWINGKVSCYSYSPETKEEFTLDHHKSSCRALAHSADGKFLFTGSSDCSLAAIDITTGKMLFQKHNVHSSGLNCMITKDQSLITGDDEGAVKVWDLRQQKEVFSWHENEDYISGFYVHPSNQTLLATSGDSTLSVFNARKGKLQSRSDYVNDELLSIAVIKDTSRVVCGTQDGILQIWNWGDWDFPTDRIRGHPQSIDTMIKIDEDTICTGSSDGMLRLVAVQPNKNIGPIGDHNNSFPVECIDMSHDKMFMASCSHDFNVHFLNIAFLYEEDGDEEEAEDDMGKGKEKIDEGDNTMEEDAEEEEEAEMEDEEEKPDPNNFYSGFQ
eukprot:TRINITY_DN3722_c0_g1_i1.p1 TRINITY_DN3722_c0_g1~~TRINITY_DN3722_c0_g1_i1.p1  ORF type:complete len:361 (-),score=94.50 TRINITY_DN3722_c0_g1_i1:37-1119(-)